MLSSDSAALRARHSVPTRRSSDLRVAATADETFDGADILVEASRLTEPEPLLRTAVVSRDASTRMSAPRSEEHTSELQSPVQLVCRLLLEKKTSVVSLRPRKPRQG